MAAVFATVQRYPPTASSFPGKISKPINPNEARSRFQITPSARGNLHDRRHLLASSWVAFVAFSFDSTPLPLLAHDEPNATEEKETGIAGGIKSFFDPNEKTKSGKVLPKAYLKSAREVLRTLRDSLKEDPKDLPKFRRASDAARESIQEYLGNWRGQKAVVGEESYVVLEKAIRSLASFYSNSGPSAPLPEDLKSLILDDLAAAEEFL